MENLRKVMGTLSTILVTFRKPEFFKFILAVLGLFCCAWAVHARFLLKRAGATLVVHGLHSYGA